MRSARVWLSVFILLAAVAGEALAQAPALSCHGAQKPSLLAELMFGRDIGHRIGVSEKAWERFVAREITPRFPDGLTVTDASGQWRDPTSGRIVREPSKLVIIVLPGNADDEELVSMRLWAPISGNSCQQSVGVVVQSVCASF